MITKLKNAIDSNSKEIPEIMQLDKSISAFEKAVQNAKVAISHRVMSLFQNGNVEEVYKLKPLVEILNDGDELVSNTTLASDISNKRPLKVSFMNKEIECNTWRGVSEAVLNILYASNKQGFNSLLKNEEFSSKTPYLAKSAEGMKGPMMLGNGAQTVYADVARITNNDFFYLKKILSALDHDVSEVILDLDPNYSRKPFERTKKIANAEQITDKTPKKRGRKPKNQNTEEKIAVSAE